MKGSRLLGRVRTDLADLKGKRWKDDYLFDVISDFLADITMKQPQLLVKPRNVVLKSGDLVDLSGCCVAVSRVDGVIDTSGAVIKELRPQSMMTRALYRRAPCSSSTSDARLNGAPDSYTVDSKTPTSIFFNPPVPPGKSFKIRLWCVPRPAPVTAESNVNFPTELFPDLFRYVRAQALGIEQESASSQSVSSKEEITGNRSLQQKGSTLASFLKASI